MSKPDDVADYDLLTASEYLLDPPESIWQDILNVDHAAWLETREMEVLQQAEARTREVAKNITREAWLGLYSPGNPIKPQAPDGLRVTHSIFGHAERMDEWKALRASTGADEVACAFGAAHFARELIDKLPPEVRRKMEEAQQAQDALDELRSEMQALQAFAAEMGATQSRQSDGKPGDPTQGLDRREVRGRAQQLQGQVQQAQAKAAATASEVTKAMDEASARIEQALAGSITEAAANLSGLKTAAQEFGFGWGLGASASATRQEIEGLQDLADYLARSSHLRQLLEVLGWAKRMVSAERRRSRRGREKFTHHRTQELDLETIAPEELMGLVDPDPESPMALDFLRRALDGELLHRQYEGEDEAGRGPFVILNDKSGSMRGWPNATACALELALMKLAMQERRRFVSIPFSGAGQYEVYDPGPRPDPRELVEHLERFYSGGTEPYAPLTAAVQRIQEDPSLREGDILIITDGSFGPPPEGFLDLLDEARMEPGLKLVAVVIKGQPSQAGFADRAILLDDLFQERDRLAEAIRPLL